MQFTFETNYNQKTLSVMAKCIRKVARKAKSKRSHLFGWIVVALALFLSFVNGKKILTWMVAAIIVITLFFEDYINGYFAKKRLLKGTEKAASVFDTAADTFTSETAVGKSEFTYDRIMHIAETDDYFVFIFSENHAQIYDKKSCTGGSIEEFKRFLSEKTGKPVVTVKGQDL